VGTAPRRSIMSGPCRADRSRKARCARSPCGDRRRWWRLPMSGSCHGPGGRRSGGFPGYDDADAGA
jgi:hypothetical protein